MNGKIYMVIFGSAVTITLSFLYSALYSILLILYWATGGLEPVADLGLGAHDEEHTEQGANSSNTHTDALWAIG